MRVEGRSDRWERAEGLANVIVALWHADDLRAPLTATFRTETTSKHAFALGQTTTPPPAPALQTVDRGALLSPGVSASWSAVANDNGNRPDDGATRNVPRGAYADGTAYQKGDIVTYSGSSYVARSDVPAGNAPTNATYWQLLVAGGVPGPAGANGQPSFVHVAYANSADGSQAFVTGVANPGRTFIGIYTDATSAGSGDYHSYYWSRLTGQDGQAGQTGPTGQAGPSGTNRTPGPVGANGQTSYVHFAYADSADGTVNFTADAPGARKYIGVYTDFTVPDSTNPALYSWSLIKGLDGAVGAPGATGATGATGASGGTGPAGANAPQVIIQYSSDKASWHPAAAGGDIYLRLSYDGGATFGNAILIQGGGFVFAFYRTTGTPPAPSSNPGAAVPPHGWYASDPGGSGQLWFTFARIDGTGYNLTGWNTATKVQGQDGSPGSPGANGSNGSNGANGANGTDGLSALNVHTVGAVGWDECREHV